MMLNEILKVADFVPVKALNTAGYVNMPCIFVLHVVH